MRSSNNLEESYACVGCNEPTIRICPTCALLHWYAPLSRTRRPNEIEPRYHVLSVEAVHLHCLRCNAAISTECNMCISKKNKGIRRSNSKTSSTSSIQSPIGEDKNGPERFSQQDTVPADLSVSPRRDLNVFEPAFNHRNLTKLFNSKP